MRGYTMLDKSYVSAVSPAERARRVRRFLELMARYVERLP